MEAGDIELAVVGQIYDAASNGALWPEGLESLAESLDAAGAMLRTQHATSGIVDGSASFGLDPDLMTVFCRQCTQPKSNRLVQRLPILSVAAPLLRQAFFSDREYVRRPIFDAIFRPQRRYLAAAVRLSSDTGDCSAVLTLFHDRLS